MAGKLHIDYLAYVSPTAANRAISPFSKLAKAYAEGYRGAVVQLSGDPTALAAYNNGVANKAAPFPPSHCAG
jgi:hypothetical protein